jgi:hypothetical protein
VTRDEEIGTTTRDEGIGTTNADVASLDAADDTVASNRRATVLRSSRTTETDSFRDERPRAHLGDANEQDFMRR